MVAGVRRADWVRPLLEYTALLLVVVVVGRRAAGALDRAALLVVVAFGFAVPAVATGAAVCFLAGAACLEDFAAVEVAGAFPLVAGGTAAEARNSTPVKAGITK